MLCLLSSPTLVPAFMFQSLPACGIAKVDLFDSHFLAVSSHYPQPIGLSWSYIGGRRDRRMAVFASGIKLFVVVIFRLSDGACIAMRRFVLFSGRSSFIQGGQNAGAVDLYTGWKCQKLA